MSRRGEYSSKYGYNKSTISFSCGGISMVDATHGTLSVSDIDGAQPRKYTSERFEPSLAVSCPVDQQFLPTRDRHIQRNPLDPVYDIPELEDVQENILRPRAPSEVPKFLRDTMDLSDIDGAQRRPIKEKRNRKNLTLVTEDINQISRREKLNKACDFHALNISDIPGTSPKTNIKEHRRFFPEYLIDHDCIGTSTKSSEWRLKHFSNLRDQGKKVNRARENAEKILASVPLDKALKSGNELITSCRKFDREKSGYVTQKELESAMKTCNLGISTCDIDKLIKGLAATDSSSPGLIPYKQVAGSLLMTNKSKLPSKETTTPLTTKSVKPSKIQHTNITTEHGVGHKELANINGFAQAFEHNHREIPFKTSKKIFKLARQGTIDLTSMDLCSQRKPGDHGDIPGNKRGDLLWFGKNQPPPQKQSSAWRPTRCIMPSGPFLKNIKPHPSSNKSDKKPQSNQGMKFNASIAHVEQVQADKEVMEHIPPKMRQKLDKSEQKDSELVKQLDWNLDANKQI